MIIRIEQVVVSYAACGCVQNLGKHRGARGEPSPNFSQAHPDFRLLPSKAVRRWEIWDRPLLAEIVLNC